MNPLAKIHRTVRSEIEISRILNIRARELYAPLALADETKEPRHEPDCEADCDHDHHQEHDHSHDDKVGSFHIVEERPLDLKKTQTWLGELLQTMGADIYRSKGILFVKAQPKRIVFQGVQMMFEAQPERFWNAGEKRQSQLVFIGRELNQEKIRSGLESCIAV
jgi:G3E family GTPase